MHLPDHLIEDVRRRIDLVALARASTPLRKQGTRHLGCCPFHKEKTPSFSVDAQKGVFYCFGCHVGGDGFAFVMKMHGLSFGQAVRHLADRFGIAIAGDTPERRQALAKEEQIRKTLVTLQGQFRLALNAPAGKAARQYLRERGVEPAISKEYGVGFGGERQAMNERLQHIGVRREELDEAGVGGAGGAPLFSGRLTFPIYDVAGGLTGFGGRLLEAEATQAKYLNSRDCALFHKQRELFGLSQGAPAIRQSGLVYVCEGYFDVMALAQVGRANAVAALGTALTTHHAEQLAKLCQHVVLVFDGDKAGMRAARKAAGPLKAHGFRIDVARLPRGDDPSSLLQKEGKETLVKALDARVPAIDAFIEQAFAEGAGDDASGPAPHTIEGKVAAADSVAPLILGLASTLEKELYVARVAERVGVSAEHLLRDWQQKARQQSQKVVRAQRPARPPDSHNAASPVVVSDAGAFAETSHAPSASAQPALPAAPPDFPAPWNAAAARRLAQHELDMVRELLLYQEARTEMEPIAEYLITAELRKFVEAWASFKGEQGAEALPQVFDETLTRCVTTPAYQHRLRAVQPIVAQTLDEGRVRANRTVADILRRLKRRQVDWTLRRVLRELGEAEARGEATDALLRRKQILTARKRALSHPT